MREERVMGGEGNVVRGVFGRGRVEEGLGWQFLVGDVKEMGSEGSF